jgi:hypothetical protein
LGAFEALPLFSRDMRELGVGEHSLVGYSHFHLIRVAEIELHHLNPGRLESERLFVLNKFVIAIVSRKY